MKRSGLWVFLCLATLSLVASNDSRNVVVNKLIERNIYIRHSHVVRHDLIVDFTHHDPTNSKTPLYHYDFVLPEEVVSQLSYLMVVSLPDGRPLKHDENPPSQPSKDTKCPNCETIRYVLNEGLPVGESKKLKVLMTFGDVTEPYPKKVPQGGRQYFKYQFNGYFLSPYQTLSERTVAHFLPGSIESYSQVEKVTRSDDKITFGPYENISPFASLKCYVHFMNNQPKPILKKYQRQLSVSHWINKIIVEEVFDLMNDAPRLDKEFSRVDLGHSYYHKDKVYPLTSVPFSLPQDAHFISCRDEVGNVSTSRIITDMKSKVLDVKPRFPLFGGWNSSIELSYYTSLQHNITRVPSSDTYVLKVPLFNLFADTTIKEFQFQVVLPEGARNVKAISPSVGHEFYTHKIGYLDTVGRTVYNFHSVNFVREHEGFIEIAYEYSLTDMLKKPLLVIIAIFALFVLYISYKRFFHHPEDGVHADERCPSKIVPAKNMTTAK